MDHPKTLFFIDNQQPQVLIFHILGKHPMGTDDDINIAFLHILYRFLLFPAGTETGKQVHPHGKILHPLHKRVIVLLRQDGSGHEVNYLFSLLDRLKGRPDGYFRLAIPHIAADKPVHNLGALHIRLRIRNGQKLILRLLIGKKFFEFLLPHRIFPVHEAFLLLAHRI